MRVDKLNNRHNFEKITTTNELPNLLDLQVGSFHDFLQEGINPKEREMFGLHEAFASIFLYRIIMKTIFLNIKVTQ